VNYPFGDFGRAEPPKQPKVIAFKNAMIWTCGPSGVIRGGTVVVAKARSPRSGKDIAIPMFPKLSMPMDDTSRPHYRLPFPHGHDGGITNRRRRSRPEVRIGRFLSTPTTFRHLPSQLAGGVTAANVLHGCGNPIGGQNQG